MTKEEGIVILDGLDLRKIHHGWEVRGAQRISSCMFSENNPERGCVESRA